MIQNTVFRIAWWSGRRLFFVLVAFWLLVRLGFIVQERFFPGLSPLPVLARTTSNDVAQVVRFLFVPRVASDCLVPLFMLFGLFFTARFVAKIIFPSGTPEERRRAFGRVLAAALENSLPTVIYGREGGLEINPTDASFEGPGLLVNDAWTAVVTRKEGHFFRALGAGISELEEDELVYTSVDLRPQTVQRAVLAHTRDALQVRIPLNLTLEVQRPVGWTIENGSFEFVQEALFQLAYHERADKFEAPQPSGKRPPALCWIEALEGIAVEGLRQEVARYTLDQLLASDDPALTSSKLLDPKIKERVKPHLEKYGASFLSLTIGEPRVPDPLVINQIESWQTVWKRRELIAEARIESERKQYEDTARLLAQREIIKHLLDALGQDVSRISPDILFLRLLQAMEYMAQDTRTRDQISPEDREALKRLLDPRHAPGTLV